MDLLPRDSNWWTIVRIHNSDSYGIALPVISRRWLCEYRKMHYGYYWTETSLWIHQKIDRGNLLANCMTNLWVPWHLFQAYTLIFHAGVVPSKLLNCMKSGPWRFRPNWAITISMMSQLFGGSYFVFGNQVYGVEGYVSVWYQVLTPERDQSPLAVWFGGRRRARCAWRIEYAAHMASNSSSFCLQ